MLHRASRARMKQAPMVARHGLAQDDWGRCTLAAGGQRPDTLVGARPVDVVMLHGGDSQRPALGLAGGLKVLPGLP